MPNPIPEIEALLTNILDGKDVYSKAFSLRDACATLLAVAKEYGGHKPGCPALLQDSFGSTGTCTCGWTAINETPEATQGE